MLMAGYPGNARVQDICEDEKKCRNVCVNCMCGRFGALEWTSLLMPLRINQPQAKYKVRATHSLMVLITHR